MTDRPYLPPDIRYAPKHVRDAYSWDRERERTGGECPYSRRLPWGHGRRQSSCPHGLDHYPQQDCGCVEEAELARQLLDHEPPPRWWP